MWLHHRPSKVIVMKTYQLSAFSAFSAVKIVPSPSPSACFVYSAVQKVSRSRSISPLSVRVFRLTFSPRFQHSAFRISAFSLVRLCVLCVLCGENRSGIQRSTTRSRIAAIRAYSRSIALNRAQSRLLKPRKK